MKKNVLLVIALFGTLSTYAQVSFGVKAGFSSAKVKFDLENAPAGFDPNEGMSRLPAWHAGLIADIQLADNFYLQPGLMASAKGVKSKFEETIEGTKVSMESKVSLLYLEVPVNFLYKHELGSGKIFGGFGPYVAYGIGGKVKTKGTGGGSSASVDNKVKFDGKKDADLPANDEDLHLKGLDAGGNFIVGYELKSGLLLSVNYSLGLVNTDPNDKASSKNNYFGISLGYILKKK